MDYAGGQAFTTKMGTVVSANITPDPETGIGKWNREFFIKKFREYTEMAEQGPPPLSGPQAFTLMPWLGMSRLADEDLGAMYDYLKTLKPVGHYVERHPEVVRSAGVK